MKKKVTYYFGLAAIVAISLVLRVYQLAAVPPGLNRDEAALGYNAYSLLKTGKDEYGINWPLSFKSFGDWKLPMYFYITTPFVKVFGLTEEAVRLPSALLGTLTVFFTYFLVKEVFEKHIYPESTGKEKDKARLIALVSALLLAITPWHLFLSRTASEANTAVFLTTVGLYMFFRSFRNHWLVFPAFLCFSLTIYAYHGNHLLTPLLVIPLGLLYIGKLLKNKWFIPSVIIFLVLSGIILSQTLFTADQIKLSGLFPLGDEAKLYEHIVLRRQEYGDRQLQAKIFNNKGLYIVRTVAVNYIKGLSPEFLFISGGTNAQHNIPGVGNLYLWEFFIWPVGLYYLLRQRSKAAYFLIIWFLVSPIPASITRDAPHTSRMAGILPLTAVLSAVGLIELLRKLRFKGLQSVGLLIGATVILAQMFMYLDLYFIHFPYSSAKSWGSGLKEMVTKVNRLQDKYKEIVISRPETSPYIYVLFYNRVDPVFFQNEVSRYPETDEGFQHVKSIGKYTFRKNNWTDELVIPNRLYVEWAEGMPSSATNSAILVTKDVLTSLVARSIDTHELKLGDMVRSSIVDTIYLPDGMPYLYLIETRLGKSVAKKS